jgi:hypothetical protein
MQTGGAGIPFDRITCDADTPKALQAASRLLLHAFAEFERELIRERL